MEHSAILVFTLDMLVFLDYSYRDVILVLGILLFLRVIFFSWRHSLCDALSIVILFLFFGDVAVAEIRAILFLESVAYRRCRPR